MWKMTENEEMQLESLTGNKSGNNSVEASELDMTHRKVQNEFGEKYKLEKVENIGILQTPIIIGVFSGLNRI